jgi:hypothetical protein
VRRFAGRRHARIGDVRVQIARFVCEVMPGAAGV